MSNGKNSLLQTKLFINGKWQNAIQNKSFCVKNPSTQDIIAHGNPLSRPARPLACGKKNRLSTALIY